MVAGRRAILVQVIRVDQHVIQEETMPEIQFVEYIKKKVPLYISERVHGVQHWTYQLLSRLLPLPRPQKCSWFQSKGSEIQRGSFCGIEGEGEGEGSNLGKGQRETIEPPTEGALKKKLLTLAIQTAKREVQCPYFFL